MKVEAATAGAKRPAGVGHHNGHPAGGREGSPHADLGLVYSLPRLHGDSPTRGPILAGAELWTYCVSSLSSSTRDFSVNAISFNEFCRFGGGNEFFADGQISSSMFPDSAWVFRVFGDDYGYRISRGRLYVHR